MRSNVLVRLSVLYLYTFSHIWANEEWNIKKKDDEGREKQISVSIVVCSEYGVWYVRIEFGQNARRERYF